MATIKKENLTPVLRNYIELKEREEKKKAESEKTPLMKYMEKAKESGTLLSSADMHEGEDVKMYAQRVKDERLKQEEAGRKAQSERIAAARPMEQVYGDLDRLKARREAFEKTEAANDIADAINDLNMREQKELLEANRITNKSQSEVDDIRADIQKKYAALRKELENSGE